MRRRPAVARHAFVLLSACSLLAACTKGKERADSAAATGARAPAPGAPAPLVGSAAPGGIPALPGALTKPMAQYSAEEFHTLVSALAFGGGIDKPRKCKGNAACDAAGGLRTSARVDAVDGQDSLDVHALPANGVVAVRARNTGAYQEARYGMKPGPFEYYLVVLPGTGGNGTWTMQQLGTAPGSRTLTQVGSGTFMPCNHPFQKRKNRANFYTCNDAHMANDSTMKMPLMMQDGSTDPVWMVCAQGCCTVV